MKIDKNLIKYWRIRPRMFIIKVYTFMKNKQRFVSTIGYYRKFYILVIFHMFLHFAVFCEFLWF